MDDNTILNKFLNNAFNLKSHLIEYLSIKECDLDGFLANAKMNLANLHPGDALNDVSDFYTEIVGDRHVADLAAWHITSRDYIADTLKLQQRFSKDLVLDFGGGIGTHALANAMSSKVEHVFFVDINQTNRNFVEYRAKKLGVEKKLTFCKTIEDTNILKFDTIVCLDVLEHLADPASQLIPSVRLWIVILLLYSIGISTKEITMNILFISMKVKLLKSFLRLFNQIF